MAALGSPSRSDLVSVIGEVFCALPDFDWRKVTGHLSPPCREWLADAVDEYFRDDPHDDGSEPVLADRWWNALPEPPPTPCADGFHWIGQPFWSCDNCGLPAWEHAGRARSSGGPFGAERWHVEPWPPGFADEIRNKWEPEMLARASRSR